MNIEIKHEYIDNGSDTLILVFQDAFLNLNNIIDMTKDEFSEYANEKHSRYTHYKLMSNNGADKLFIQDNFSNSYGWYLFNSGDVIVSEIQDFIKSKIKNRHKKIIAFGSSKGGFGALIYGSTMDEIDATFAVIPQINIKKILNRNSDSYRKLKELIICGNEGLLAKYENYLLDNISGKNNIYVYTCEKDFYYSDIAKIDEYQKIFAPNNELHDFVVLANLPDIERIIYNLCNNLDIYAGENRKLSIKEKIKLELMKKTITPKNWE